eukprot:Colp12_sorted_trinity150504_noHs@4678
MSASVEEKGVGETKKAPESIQDRLFNLRMKINQGRKANKEEVEEEYKRFSNPKYEQKQRYLQKVAEAQQGEGETLGDEPAPKSKKWDKEDGLMQQTAEQAEYAAEKARKKEEIKSTFGWQAFTAEATHRAYEKRLKKLPTGGRSSSSSAAESHLEENPLDYGKSGTSVSKAGLDRLTKDIEDKEEARRNFSKRRMNFDASDVDYINDKNAIYNKKLKRAFDKYTVEIRQNLERGTAV